MKRLIIHLLLFICPAISFAADANHYNPKFQQGTKLLLDEHTIQALSIFNQVYHAGAASPELLNNIGNAYFKQQHYGKAIAFYEKALLLAPRDTQLMHNRQIALGKLNRNATKAGFLSGVITTRMVDRLLIITAAFMFISGLVFFVNATGTLRKWQSTLKANSLSLIVTSAFFFILLSALLCYDQSKNYAIITNTSAIARVGPSALAKKTATLNEGDYVETDTYYKGWFKIKTQSGSIAWVYFKDMELIN